MLESTTEIIIVKYGLREYENECVSQVLEYTEDPYNLTVYENWNRDANLSVVWNECIRRSDAEYICLLNNDTVVTKHWLTKLLATFGQYDNVGAVGPVSNKAGGQQGGHTDAMPDGVVQECHTLSGFCLAFPRSVWAEVDGFDERYELYGEDSDFCNRILRAGYRLYTRFDTWIYHHKSQSCKNADNKGKDIAKIRQESAQLFKKTWYEN